MKKTIKAVLLSALLYPGAGHFFLKKYVHSLALVSAFSVPFFLIISDIVDKTNQIVEQIENGEIPLDITSITAAISNLISGSEAQELNVKLYVMIIVWVIGVLDAYRLAKAKT